MSAAIGPRRAGWTPVIVERAPERRTGGYFVGLFPEGRRAAVDLGIAGHPHTRNPERKAGTNTWSLDRRGRRRPALGFLDQPGEPAAVLRGDIEAVAVLGDAPLTPPVRENLVLDIAETIGTLGGRYRTGPDIGTTPQDMAVIHRSPRGWPSAAPKRAAAAATRARQPPAGFAPLSTPRSPRAVAPAP